MPDDPVPEARLTRVLDDLAAQAPSELPAGAALERARVLLAESERLKALALLALADVDARGLFALDRVPSAASWVAAQAVPGLDRREVTLARRLPGSPAVREALTAGRLSRDAAALVAAAVRRAGPFLDRADGQIDGQPGEESLAAVGVEGVLTLLAEQTGGVPESGPLAERHTAVRAALTAVVDGPGSQRERLETCLARFAEHCAPGTLRSGLALLTDALLPAEHDRRAAEVERSAGLELVRDPLSGGWRLRGTLDDVTGELLATVLRAAEETDPARPDDTSAWRAAAAGPHGTDLTGPGALPPAEWPTETDRPRGRAARALDALRHGLRRLLDTGALGLRDKAHPHLLVTVDSTWLAQSPGALPPRAAGGAALTRRALTDLACGSAFTRLVLSTGRRVIEASHTQRTATALERLVLGAEWAGRCAAAGCSRGPATGDRLVPHHADLFAHTGRTALVDTRPLCLADHHRLHEERRAVRLRDGRVLGPDGWLDDGDHPGRPAPPGSPDPSSPDDEARECA